MKKSVIYKISGILIVLFWLFVVAELVKRTNCKQKSADVTHIDKHRSLENRSEEWKEIFLKGRKVGYTVTRVKAIKDIFEVSEDIFLAVNLMGSTQEILSSTKAEIDEEFLLNNFNFSLSSGLIEFKISGTFTYVWQWPTAIFNRQGSYSNKRNTSLYSFLCNPV